MKHKGIHWYTRASIWNLLWWCIKYGMKLNRVFEMIMRFKYPERLHTLKVLQLREMQLNPL